MTAPLYVHLPPCGPLPPLGPEPFKALLVIENIVTDDWRSEVCAWLSRSGCRYFLAWGQDSALWEDVMDQVGLEMHGSVAGDDEKMIMTTSHTDETLADAVWFAVHTAKHPGLALATLSIIHITPVANREEMMKMIEAAVSDWQ